MLEKNTVRQVTLRLHYTETFETRKTVHGEKGLKVLECISACTGWKAGK